ncbi:MAG: hypothetical protein ACR2P6_07570 [Gammaproteobacteria bacterium]
MASKLVQRDGVFYKRQDNGKWLALSPSDAMREQVMQRGVQSQSFGTRAMVGAGHNIRNILSAAREFTYGDPATEQQFRADAAQQYQPHKDYGGVAPVVGEFGSSAATALIPGGLKTQVGIGSVQGALEHPDSPWMGAGFGGAMTFAGDYLMNALGRISRTLNYKARAVNPDYAGKLQRGVDEGLQFTPGQMTDDPATRIMEKQLMKNPRFAQLDMDRFLSNQAALNDTAARMLDEVPTGRISPDMRGRAVDSVKAAFDDIAENSEPVTLLGQDWLDEFGQLTDAGHNLHERFIKKFPGLFEGQPINGKQFVDARNWLANQSRKTANWQSGAAEEMQPFLRIMDDSLESANEAANPMMVENIRRGRMKWKSLMVIEDSLKGAEQAAKGNLTAGTAYNVLKRYDKGGIFRGRSRDPFNTIIDAMAASGDAPPSVMPSLDAGTGPIQALKSALWSGPAAERYMRGENLGRVMLGQLEEAGQLTRGMQQLGVGVPRGLMGISEQDELE